VMNIIRIPLMNYFRILVVNRGGLTNKTRRGAEIDFAIGSDDAIRLIQVCWELRPTREHEVRALSDAMEELGCSEAQIITAWEEETIVNETSGKTIRVVPAYKWLLKR
jgi:predicted AAA+ superfamily ATPase